MDKYIINGGNKLYGEIKVQTAKNSVLPILAAAVLTDGEVRILNAPHITDVKNMVKILACLGCRAVYDGGDIIIDSSSADCFEIPRALAHELRSSVFLLGPVISRFGRAKIAYPGGCDIGCRAIDQHIKGFKALGASVSIAHGMITAEAPRLTGAHIYLDVVSVGATINIMMAAVLAEGRTTIENAAKEPHVVDLANFLNSMGANVKGAGTDVIRIRGVERLHRTEYAIIPDQIEAGTFMFAAAATRGDITVKNVIPKHLESISAKLTEIGCEVSEFDDAVRVVASKPLKHTHVKTLPYPGFPTDMQPQIVVALGLSKGTSIVTESIFENRFRYVEELIRMGANIKVEGTTAIIEGVSRYTGASINAPDLRAGAALVIAALAAEGMSVVDDIRYIERGYEDFHLKLQKLGAQIEKVETDRELQKFRLKIG